LRAPDFCVAHLLIPIRFRLTSCIGYAKLHLGCWRRAVLGGRDQPPKPECHSASASYVFCLCRAITKTTGVAGRQGKGWGVWRIAGCIEGFTITKDVCHSGVRDACVRPANALVQFRGVGCRRDYRRGWTSNESRNVSENKRVAKMSSYHYRLGNLSTEVPLR
jgi:hypothetical protein